MLKAYWNQEPLYTEVTQDDDDESTPVEEFDTSENFENGHHASSRIQNTSRNIQNMQTCQISEAHDNSQSSIYPVANYGSCGHQQLNTSADN